MPNDSIPDYRQARCPHGWVNVTQCQSCAIAAERDALLEWKRAHERQREPALTPQRPNAEGETECRVRWMVETPAGWLGAWDIGAFEAYLAAERDRLHQCAISHNVTMSELHAAQNALQLVIDAMDRY